MTRCSGYLEHVGRARLVYSVDPKLEPDALAKSSSAFISIPHVHPGYDAKGPQCVLQRRIYLSTNVLTWVYINTAISVVTSNRVDLSNR